MGAWFFGGKHRCRGFALFAIGREDVEGMTWPECLAALEVLAYSEVGSSLLSAVIVRYVSINLEADHYIADCQSFRFRNLLCCLFSGRLANHTASRKYSNLIAAVVVLQASTNSLVIIQRSAVDQPNSNDKQNIDCSHYTLHCSAEIVNE